MILHNKRLVHTSTSSITSKICSKTHQITIRQFRPISKTTLLNHSGRIGLAWWQFVLKHRDHSIKDYQNKYLNYRFLIYYKFPDQKVLIRVLNLTQTPFETIHRVRRMDAVKAEFDE